VSAKKTVYVLSELSFGGMKHVGELGARASRRACGEEKKKGWWES
jgi:hypothetical protein